MKYLVAAAALLAFPAAAHAQGAAKPAATPEPLAAVYDKALGPGWENWSWATTELSVENAGAHKPIMVDAKGWQALYLHHAAFSTAPYRGISLLIQSVGGDATVRVVAIVDGKPVTDPAPAGQDAQPKGHTVAVKPGGWVEVQVPLKELGVDNKTIDGIWIQNATPDQAPHFYVADVKLVP